MNRVIRITLVALAIAALAFPVAAQQATPPAASNPLVQLLQSKGILTAEEAANIGAASTPADANERLAHLLLNKGLISQEEYNATAAASVVPVAGSQAAPGGARLVNAAASASPGEAAITANSATTEKKKEAFWPISANMIGYDPSDGTSADASVIPAIAPVRVLPIGIPKDPKGIIPDIKLGSGAMLNFYGFFKASAIYDSTNVGGSTFNGDDFPLPLLQGDTGPDAASQFRMKARAVRMGANFYYPINGPDITLTGKLEFDWQGDYTTVDNTNISSTRTTQPALRLAWMRVDAKVGGTPWFAEFGQDWTFFGSSTQWDLVESGVNGVFMGNVYERLPQFKTGFQFTAGDVKIEPEVQILLGAFGDQNLNNSTANALLGAVGVVPTGFQNQSREGAMLGPASGQPGVEGRLVIDFPLDKSWKGVPNAELIVAGGHAEGEEIIPIGNIPETAVALPTGVTALTCASNGANVAAAGGFRNCYPRGFTMNIPQNVVDAEFQLPMPWITLTGKAYRGGDLRFMFGGLGNSVFSDLLGGTAIAAPPTTVITCVPGTPSATVPVCPSTPTSTTSIASSSTIAQTTYAQNGDTITFTRSPAVAGASTVQFAPVRPVRGYGGFVQAGFPLSRIFGANPEGYNKGWTLFIAYGTDGAVNRDVNRLGANGLRRDDYIPVSLRYQVNKWFQIADEVTWYDTRTGSELGTTEPILKLYRGQDARMAHDWRQEFGTVFTF